MDECRDIEDLWNGLRLCLQGIRALLISHFQVFLLKRFWVLVFVCSCVCVRMCACVQKKPEEGVRSTGLEEVVNCLAWCWELSPGLLEKPPVLPSASIFKLLCFLPFYFLWEMCMFVCFGDGGTRE